MYFIHRMSGYEITKRSGTRRKRFEMLKVAMPSVKIPGCRRLDRLRHQLEALDSHEAVAREPVRAADEGGGVKAREIIQVAVQQQDARVVVEKEVPTKLRGVANAPRGHHEKALLGYDL